MGRSWGRRSLEEKEHLHLSIGGDCAYNTLPGFSPRQRKQSLKATGVVGHFLLRSAWFLLASPLGMGCPPMDLSNSCGALYANVCHKYSAQTQTGPATEKCPVLIVNSPAAQEAVLRVRFCSDAILRSL